MDGLLNFFANHYILFILISLVLIFALIGYFVKKKAAADQPYKLADANAQAELDIANLAQSVSKDASLQDFVNRNAGSSTHQQVSQPTETTVQQPAAQETIQTVESLETPVVNTSEQVNSLNDLNL